MKQPYKIDDVEIVPDRLIVYNSECIGAKKFERFIMISLIHSHGNNTNIGFQGNGYADVMLTREQAELLRDKLNELL